jgi:GxxExxY protein
MDSDKTPLMEADLTERIIGSFYSVYNELGSGFLESVYENALAIALRDSGISTTQQTALDVEFRGRTVGEFRADLLVEGRIIIEVKAVSQLIAAHEMQPINYLKATGIRVGLLLNFGPRPQFKRRVFGMNASDPCSSASIRVQDHV